MSNKVEERNKRVLEAALSLAQERGFDKLTREGVAEKAGVAAGSVNNAYGTMDGLRDAVMAAAVERGVVVIVAQGLAASHPAARAAPDELRAAAAASLAA